MRNRLTYKVGNAYLTIDGYGLHLEGDFTRKQIEEPTAIRYTTQPIQLDMFTIGRIYKIDVQDEHGEMIKIRLRDFFGLKRKAYAQLFNEIIDILWEYFFDAQLAQQQQRLMLGETLNLGDYKLAPQGIFIQRGSKTILFEWEDLLYMPKSDHLLLNAKSDHSKYTRVEFHEWNWPLLDYHLTYANELYIKNGHHDE